MPIDWTPLYRQFKGRWVALAEDEETVLGSGGTATEALAAARRNGHERPILAKLPDRLQPYVG